MMVNDRGRLRPREGGTGGSAVHVRRGWSVRACGMVGAARGGAVWGE